MDGLLFSIPQNHITPLPAGEGSGVGLLGDCVGLLLLYIIHQSEQSAPSYARESTVIGVVAPPDEYRLAHDMVFGHEAPVAWVDALVFALVAVYFINLFFFQNYVIPSSSLEKSLLTGDYLFVSKVSYGPRKPQTPLTTLTPAFHARR